MNELVSRFVLESDSKLAKFDYDDLSWDFAELKWWSRIYEYEWLQNSIKEFFKSNTGNKSAIDFATGKKHPGVFLLNNLGFNKTIGVDLMGSENWRYIDKTSDEISYLQGNMVNCKFGKHDCVVCISTLEHLEPSNQVSALKNMINHVADGGCMILTFDTPGFEHPTDLSLYKEILISEGMQFEEGESNGDLITTLNNKNAPELLRNKEYNCYRLFAWKRQQ